MEDFSPLFAQFLIGTELNRATYGNVTLYEYMKSPVSEFARRNILERIESSLNENETFSSQYNVERRGSITVVDTLTATRKNINSGASLLLIKNDGTTVVAIVKLNPRGTRRPNLTPKGLGVTRGGTPSTVGSYINFDQFISTVNNKIDEYIREEKVSSAFGEWVKLHLGYFDPRDHTIGKSQELRNLWNPSINAEITSELLEIFCGLGYIKAITTPFSGFLKASDAERNRVYQILGTTSPNANSFRIWFPESSNYPIIDCQVGYFESGRLVAVFPISTKNITGGITPNVIKFGDIFENTRQPISWKKGLPNKISSRQGVQTVVASQAVGRATGGRAAAYPIYAARSILNSSFTRAVDKQTFINNVKSLGVNINTSRLQSLLTQLDNGNHGYETPLDDILSGESLTIGKQMVLTLLRRPRTKYARTVNQLETSFLLNCNVDRWNDTVSSQLEYPFTFQNISLYFELAIEANSVRSGGPTNYQKMVVANYFTGNRVLASKYQGQPPLGATDVILAKVSIDNGGLARITYNSNVRANSQYGLRSKNSLNNLQDTLGIAP